MLKIVKGYRFRLCVQRLKILTACSRIENFKLCVQGLRMPHDNVPCGGVILSIPLWLMSVMLVLYGVELALGMGIFVGGLGWLMVERLRRNDSL